MCYEAPLCGPGDSITWRNRTWCVLVPLLQVWEERDRQFTAAGDLTMEDDCLILLIDADTKVGNVTNSGMEQHAIAASIVLTAPVANRQTVSCPRK